MKKKIIKKKKIVEKKIDVKKKNIFDLDFSNFFKKIFPWLIMSVAFVCFVWAILCIINGNNNLKSLFSPLIYLYIIFVLYFSFIWTECNISEIKKKIKIFSILLIVLSGFSIATIPYVLSLLNSFISIEGGYMIFWLTILLFPIISMFLFLLSFISEKIWKIKWGLFFLLAYSFMFVNFFSAGILFSVLDSKISKEIGEPIEYRNEYGTF